MRGVCQAALSVRLISVKNYLIIEPEMNRQKKFEEALALLKRAIAADDSQPECYDVHGDCLVGLSQLEKAIASYDRAGDLSNKKNSQTRTMLAHDVAKSNRDVAFSQLNRVCVFMDISHELCCCIGH